MFHKSEAKFVKTKFFKNEAKFAKNKFSIYFKYGVRVSRVTVKS